ncbi:hypothetical protein KSP40_PGU008306 [Platanthera guangdongensis]|uniref:Uncharacterized protein n=1 Tax=Platanthera guangdongensis TaxID=2320717 RepID=A0ABR2M9U5_9ASPA
MPGASKMSLMTNSSCVDVASRSSTRRKKKIVVKKYCIPRETDESSKKTKKAMVIASKPVEDNPCSLMMLTSLSCL